MNVVFDAWYKFGNIMEFPDRFPPAGALGGERGLKSLIDYTHDLGYKFYLTDWNMEIASEKGVTKSADVIYDIQGAPLNWGSFLEPYYLLNPRGVKKLLDVSMKHYKEWGIDGIEEFDADMLVSSQKADYRIHREQTKNEMNEVYKYMKEELGDVRLWRGMAYSLVNNATVVDPAARYSFSPLIDEYVPIYFMGLRGLVDFVTIPVNTMNDITYNTLKAAEFGQNLSYELTWQPTDDLFYAYNSWFLSSTQHDNFRDEYIAMYNRYNGVFADLQGQFIVKHEELEENIFRTTFEGGKRIICNYRESAYAYNGISIPAMSFAIEEEGTVTLP
jgi:hypothetical protein